MITLKLSIFLFPLSEKATVMKLFLNVGIVRSRAANNIVSFQARCTSGFLTLFLSVTLLLVVQRHLTSCTLLTRQSSKNEHVVTES